MTPAHPFHLARRPMATQVRDMRYLGACLFLIGCGGNVAGTTSVYEPAKEQDAAPCAAHTEPPIEADAGTPDAADPVEQQACDLLSRYYSALQAAHCVHVITIVSGETCADSLVRIEGCINDSACHHTMEVGCPGGLPELK